VDIAEHRRFGRLDEVAADVPPSIVDDLDARLRETRLSVLPRLSSFWMPRRHRRPPRQSIGPGEWVRWTVNYRRGLADVWEYGLVTWSIAFRPERRQDDLFLDKPTILTKELAALR